MTKSRKKLPALESQAVPEFSLTATEWDEVVRELDLSTQQMHVVRLILTGKRDKEIAAELRVSKNTIRTYLRRIFSRNELSDRMALVIRVFAICRDIQGRRGVTQNNDT